MIGIVIGTCAVAIGIGPWVIIGLALANRRPYIANDIVERIDAYTH